jgi:hypothetical protein
MDWRILEWLNSQWLAMNDNQSTKLIVDPEELAKLQLGIRAHLA